MATIWVDADATPRMVLEVLERASRKREVPLVLVANRWMEKPRAPLGRSVQVGAGADVADDHIAEHCEKGDLVITADIPLAARVVERGGKVLQPRGGWLDEANVRERLSLRDFGEGLREMGIMTSGPSPFTKSDLQKFSNALDRWITARR